MHHSNQDELSWVQESWLTAFSLQGVSPAGVLISLVKIQGKHVAAFCRCILATLRQAAEQLASKLSSQPGSSSSEAAADLFSESFESHQSAGRKRKREGPLVVVVVEDRTPQEGKDSSMPSPGSPLSSLQQLAGGLVAKHIQAKVCQPDCQHKPRPAYRYFVGMSLSVMAENQPICKPKLQ